MVQHTIQNESPQGVFIFLGSPPNGLGTVLMIIVLIGILLYVTWRYIETVFKQGSTPQLSKWQNFFRYRLSPFVSGTIYLLYAIVLIDILVQSDSIHNGQDVNGSCFPSCWANTVGGKIGLFFVALALFIAFITQMIQTIWAPYMTELNEDISSTSKRPIYYLMQVIGRLGFLGRAILFILVAIVFAQVLIGVKINQDQRLYTMAQALNYWAANTAGRIVLIVMGALLIIYGIFAFLCTGFRQFPTNVVIER